MCSRRLGETPGRLRDRSNSGPAESIGVEASAELSLEKEDRMGGAVVMALIIVWMAGITVYLVGALARSIGHEKRARMGLWKNFGLSMGFCVLFVLSWIGQGAAQWQEYTDEQRSLNEPVELGDFGAVFSQATLENWQSEFLQLFSCSP
jgi:hypothetical protein